jgi:hypothetical protein
MYPEVIIPTADALEQIPGLASGEELFRQSFDPDDPRTWDRQIQLSDEEWKARERELRFIVESKYPQFKESLMTALGQGVEIVQQMFSNALRLYTISRDRSQFESKLIAAIHSSRDIRAATITNKLPQPGAQTASGCQYVIAVTYSNKPPSSPSSSGATEPPADKRPTYQRTIKRTYRNFEELYNAMKAAPGALEAMNDGDGKSSLLGWSFPHREAALYRWWNAAKGTPDQIIEARAEAFNVLLQHLVDNYQVYRNLPAVVEFFKDDLLPATQSIASSNDSSPS